jgi:hypothetical protein
MIRSLIDVIQNAILNGYEIEFKKYEMVLKKEDIIVRSSFYPTDTDEYTARSIMDAIELAESY